MVDGSPESVSVESHSLEKEVPVATELETITLGLLLRVGEMRTQSFSDVWRKGQKARFMAR